MMEPYKNAWGHICTQSAKAACSALIPVDLIRVSALTKITGDMCSRITECYGYEQLKGLTRFCGIAAGAALGVHLANKILSKMTVSVNETELFDSAFALVSTVSDAFFHK